MHMQSDERPSSPVEHSRYSAQQAFLISEEGLLTGQRIPLGKRSIIIGRGSASDENPESQCDIVLPERQVSRQHAEISNEGGHYYLRDLQSKNGTYLNGEPVHGATELHDNDEIQIALLERFRFVGADATLPLSEVMPMGRLRLDHQSRTVWVGGVKAGEGRPIDPPLSPAQYRLLELLHEPGGRVFTRDEIVAAVWTEAEREGVTEQAIDALVRRLRERLAEVDPHGVYVVTVRGHGFRLDPTGGY